jgi:hypothetical protein
MITGMVLAASLSMTGCKLIDQTTFAPAPEAGAAGAQPTLPRVDPRTPLVTIGFAHPDPQYQAMLGYAVHAAEARDGNVQYDVFAVVPTKGASSAQTQAAGDAQQDALGVMKAIMTLGVPATRIHLGVRTDPAVDSNEVRVYVH